MPPVLDENVLVGLTTSDDAAVYRINDELAVVLTVDYFTPLVDDPYDFGRIAAANALSDAYAMGANPVIALNLVGFPSRDMPLTIMKEILRGGSDIAAPAGVSIVGGHSIDDPEPKYGMVVLGFARPAEIITNAAAKPGDVLLLTKPIGTGVIATAIKNDIAPPEVVERAVEMMTTLNKSASEAMKRVGANSCTDVTGFGLLGHLHEMTWASGVGGVVDCAAVPIIEGALPLIEQDMSPGGAYRNLEFLENCGVVEWNAGLNEQRKLLLVDPQTSGGLLIAVSEERADRMISELHRAGVPVVARIGRIVADTDRRIVVSEGQV